MTRISMPPILGILALFLTGCGTVPDYTTAVFATMWPETIDVLPPVNRTADREAGTVAMGLMQETIADRGYRVVNSRAPAAAAGAAAAADATLHTVVHAWHFNLNLTNGIGSSVIDIEARLLDRATGSCLWQIRRRDQDVVDDGKGNWLVNLLASALFDSPHLNPRAHIEAIGRTLPPFAERRKARARAAGAKS